MSWQNTIAELQAQITSLKTRMPGGSGEPGTTAKMQALHAKASAAERKLAQTQTQLEDAEEKLDQARQKVAVAESKWEARLRELEARCRAAEEKTKRERQGGKERAAELTDHIRFVFLSINAASLLTCF